MAMKIKRMLLFLVKYFIPRIYNLKSKTRRDRNSYFTQDYQQISIIVIRVSDARKQHMSGHPVFWTLSFKSL